MTGRTEEGQWLLGAGLGSPLLKPLAHREALPGGLHATRLCSPRPTDRHITGAVLIRLCPPLPLQEACCWQSGGPPRSPVL